MVRKSNSKRKGIPKGFQKGPVVNRTKTNQYSWLTSSIHKSLPVKDFTQFTQVAFNKFLDKSMAFHFVPLEKKPGGGYAVPTGLKMLPFWLYKILTLIIIVNRLRVSFTLCLTQDITPPLLLAVTMGAALALAWFMSVWNPVDTAFLLSNLESLLKDLSRKESRKFSLFGDLGLCLKVCCIFIFIPICAFCISVANGLLYMGTQASWLRMVESYGWLNVKSEQAIWWLMIFLPLEIATTLGPLTSAAFICIMSLLGLEAIKTYGENIRRMDVVDLKSREEVERMFIHWQIFARATNGWIKLHSVPEVLGVSGAITMTLFLTIRFTDVPIFIYICFPFLAVTFLGLLALALYEAVSVTRISQQVLSGQLLTFQQSYKLRLLSREHRKLVTLRAKAFKAIAFPIGPFTEIKYAVMADIWEEILNQLLLLLSF